MQPADQPSEIRDRALWVQKFPLNASGGVALSDLVGGLESVQVLRFISGADPDPHPAFASASPAAATSTTDASADAFPEPVQTVVWRVGGFAWIARRPAAARATRITTR